MEGFIISLGVLVKMGGGKLARVSWKRPKFSKFYQSKYTNSKLGVLRWNYYELLWGILLGKLKKIQHPKKTYDPHFTKRKDNKTVAMCIHWPLVSCFIKKTIFLLPVDARLYIYIKPPYIIYSYIFFFIYIYKYSYTHMYVFQGLIRFQSLFSFFFFSPMT